MSTWSEYFWGTSYNNNAPDDSLPPPPEIEPLPSFETFNGLAPQFQVTEEHDPNHIFPEEFELIEKVRSQVPEAQHYPAKYILIFLFARRHSVPHSVKLLLKHLEWLKKLGLPSVTEDNPYPFKADQLTEEERQVAIREGPLLYRHMMTDKHNRLLQYVRVRCWFQGRISVNRYISMVIWWYYYSFKHVPLRIHRNGMAVVIDMRDMGWANLDFSTDVQQFITTALTCFPGRMRQAWIVNPNWIFSTAWALVKMVLSTKVLSRMQQLPVECLPNEVDVAFIPKDLGGEWEPDPQKEWYDKSFELDRIAKEEEDKRKNDIH